jgi:hypothetical protein
MIFALVLERDPIRWNELPGMIQSWILTLGGMSAVAVLLFWIFASCNPRLRARVMSPGLPRWLMSLAVLAMLAGYVGCGVLYLPQAIAFITGGTGHPRGSDALRQNLLIVGSIGALVAILLPFTFDLFRLRFRRIWAIARLSFKEAIRLRILWLFFAVLLFVMLFAGWFIDTESEKDQLKGYIDVISLATMFLLLVTGTFIAAFSIPTDIRNNSVHTIVTKPVERFEIVLGRFMGFVVLMTLALFVMTGLSLLYVFREIDTEARQQSWRARVPIFGELSFIPAAGLNVGREWEYRRYIAGGSRSPQRAIWTFTELPQELADPSRTTVPCELTFDIFRTLKGEEGKGVFCSFYFSTPSWNPSRRADFDRHREAEMRKPGMTAEKVDALLAEKYGYYQIPSKVIVDYHTQQIDLPAGLFRNALSSTTQPATTVAGETQGPELLQVAVKCESGGQYLGCAKYDFYILAKEKSFILNFFKGAIGLWLRLCIVIGLAVACSTYLSGVVAFLATSFVYLAGFFHHYVQSIAEGANPGGGPLESMVRLANRYNQVTALDNSATTQLAQGSDVAYRWILRVFTAAVPDVDRFDWTRYVAEGFNIGTLDVALLNTVLVAGYLLPWAILGYYLIKIREIATY